MRQKRRGTAWLLAVLLAAGTAGILVQKFLREPGACALVEYDGREIARLKLAEDTRLLVGDEAQAYNVVEVRDGSVAVTEADCADLICVRTGRISQRGEVIACLPHRLIVTIR